MNDSLGVAVSISSGRSGNSKESATDAKMIDDDKIVTIMVVAAAASHAMGNIIERRLVVIMVDIEARSSLLRLWILQRTCR